VTQPVLAAREEGAYGVCFSTDLDDIPTDMVAKTLPKNTYAVFTHRAPLSAIPRCR
jgi:predicted transcriptional regulator YdeE